MKRIFSILALLSITSFSGCDDIPDADTIKAFSKSVGTAAALACNISGVSQEEIGEVFVILDEIKNLVPDENKKFEELWTPEINKIVDAYVAKGKLKESKAKIIKKVLITAAKGLDSLFKRKPSWKKYPDVVSAVINGFYEGFSILNKCDDCTVKTFESSMDKDTYEQLKWIE